MSVLSRTRSKNTNPAVAILGRLIEPDNDDLPRAAAEFFLSLDFRKQDHRRMKQLSTKANAGTLTPGEGDELEDYLRVADMLALLQSKARKSLKRAEALGQ